MLKRHSTGNKEENYEHVLMCLICRSLFDDYEHQPKFLPCHHTFCKDCLREYIRQTGDEIECPSCRKIANIPAAGVTALQTNFYVKYIQSLVQGGYGIEGCDTKCHRHPNRKLQFFCKDCKSSICDNCCNSSSDGATCTEHKKVSLTSITEEYHQKLDTSFAKANALIERKKVELEGMLKALSEEKDQALLKIESTFEQHVHTLNRRATLLKNKVIAIYNEHEEKLEADLEEISTAMTCIVSLKEYHENRIGMGDFIDIEQGIDEMNEVFTNIGDRIKPKENHIIFEEKHGNEKFRAGAKDLGRVRCNRPPDPRMNTGSNQVIPLTATNSQSAPNTPTIPSDGESPINMEPWECSQQTPASIGMSASLTSSIRSSETKCNDGLKCPLSTSAHAPSSYTKGNHQNIARVSPVQPELRNDTSKSTTNSTSLSSTICLNGGGDKKESPCDTAKSDQVNGVVGDETVKIDKDSVNIGARPKTLEFVGPRRPVGSASILKPVKGKRPSPQTSQPQNQRSVSYSEQSKKPPACSRVQPPISNPMRSSDAPVTKETVGYHATPPVNPDVENSKQTDKMYHHLVYTSYDEEELLRELNSGRVVVDHANGKQVKVLPTSPSTDSTVSVHSEGRESSL